jgi:hypothetical protein
MMKLTLLLTASVLMFTGVSCSSPNAGSPDRLYNTAPAPIPGKTGLQVEYLR